ncbi:MAG: archease [Thermodesulfobacteriota bacterium]
MDYRVFDHTADLGLEVSAATVEALYAAAALSLFDLLTDLTRIRARIAREVVVTGQDPAEVLVNFLREILYLWNGEQFLVKTCQVLEATPRRLKALLRGECFDPVRHRTRREIKAVTYHQAAVRQTERGWVATVVCDV